MIIIIIIFTLLDINGEEVGGEPGGNLSDDRGE